LGKPGKGAPHGNEITCFAADAIDNRDRYARAREEQADKLFREIIEIADDASGDYVTTSDGKRIVDHENIQRSRLRVDARKWAAARLAPKKYGDHISHDVKGPGANFQPAILITVDGQPHDEFARHLAYDQGGGVLLDGNGDIVRER
jgi:hypothetical protein